jgi:hypothetical protein
MKSATSHLIPVGTAVSAVGHRIITMYGCFGTTQSLRSRKEGAFSHTRDRAYE